MRSDKPKTVLLVNVLGGLVGVACTVGLLWLTVFRADGPRAEIDRIDGSIISANADLSALRATLRTQHAAVTLSRSELLVTGQLPERLPVENDLDALSKIARVNQLQVVRVTPLAPRAYSGLLELRYGFEMTGEADDFIRFLRAVEETPVWADIGYLKVERTARATPNEQGATGSTTALVTFSLFSAQPEDDFAVPEPPQ